MEVEVRSTGGEMADLLTELLRTSRGGETVAGGFRIFFPLSSRELVPMVTLVAALERYGES